MNPKVTRLLLIFTIVLLNVGCDQLTKQMAIEQLQQQPAQYYLGDIFVLKYVENTGAFLSLGSDLSADARYWILQIFPVLMLGGLLLYLIFSTALDRWQIIAFSFIVGGGLSNVYDRLMYNYVVDFMNMGIGSLRTGIFNFADVSIMIGLFMMLPFIFRKETKDESEAAEPVENN